MGFFLFIGATYSNAQVDNVLDFDGVNDYVDLSSISDTMEYLSDHFTIEFWTSYLDEDNDDYGVIFAANSSGGGNRFLIRAPGVIDDTEGIVVYFDLDGADTYLRGEIPTGDGLCHHIAFVYSEGFCEIYVDGVLDVTGFHTVDFEAGDLYSFGQEYDAGPVTSQFFDGMIEEFRIWNFAMTEEEVNEQMFSELTGLEDQLFVYFNFNQGIAGEDNSAIAELDNQVDLDASGTFEDFVLIGSFSNFIDDFCSIIDINLNDTTICIGDCIALEVVTVVAHYPIEFSWDHDESLTNDTIDVCPDSTTTYMVIASNDFGFSDTAYAVVNVNPNPAVSLGTDTTICAGDSVLLDAENPGAAYTWNDGSTDQIITVNESGTYWVEVNQEGCTQSDTIVISLSGVEVELIGDTVLCTGETILLDAGFIPGASYEWNTGFSEQTLLVSSEGFYQVTVTNGICTDTDSVTVSFVSLFLDLGTDTTICVGDSVLLDAENPGAAYTWNDGSTDQIITVNESGTYWVEVTLGDCSLIDSVTVTVVDFSVDLGEDVVLCAGDSVLLDAGSFTGVTYDWNIGATSQTISVTNDGMYSVEVANELCSGSDEILITFFSPIADFENGPVSGCSPLTVNFMDQSTTPFGDIVSWNWDFGDGGVSSSENPTHVYLSPGIYDVSLTIFTDLGCFDQIVMTDLVEVEAAANADFSFFSDNVTIGDLVEFSNLSTNASSWIWNFGDGISASTENAEHSFETAGEYTITLIAMNANGCNDTIIRKVTVKDDIHIFIPNVFTPDGDLFNQIWKPYIDGIDIYDFHLILFNRWGEIIWESYDSSAGWDGTYGGNLVQDGVYTWTIEYGVLSSDEKHHIVGHVTLLK